VLKNSDRPDHGFAKVVGIAVMCGTAAILEIY
jgi:hypothetical protein